MNFQIGFEKDRKIKGGFIMVGVLDAIPMPERDRTEIVNVDYMESKYPLYMAYETKVGKKEKYQTILADFKEMRDKLFDQETGLIYDSYEVGKDAILEDGKFKIMSAGYYLMGIIDTMFEVAEEIYEQYRAYEGMFKEAIKGVLRYYNEEEGLFRKYILTAKQMDMELKEEENPIDVKGSLMVAYAIWKACYMNVLLNEKYMPIADQLFDCARKMIDEKKTAELEDFYDWILALKQETTFEPWIDENKPV